MRTVVTDNKLRTWTVITELSIRTMIAINGITVGSFVKINIESPVVCRIRGINQIVYTVPAITEPGWLERVYIPPAS